MMSLDKRLLIGCLALSLAACTWRIGSPTRMEATPAPTSIPLNAQPTGVAASTPTPAAIEQPAPASPTLAPPTETGTQAPPSEALPSEAPPSEALPTQVIPPEQPISLPPGFGISLFAEGLAAPRMLAIGPDRQPYVAERGAGRILRLPDRDQDGVAEAPEVVAEGLNSPSSLAFYQDGSLYVGETTQILRLSEPDANGVFQNKEAIITGLPSGGHNTRTVLFSPDWSTLFVSVGSSCNVCEEGDPRRAAIVRYNPDGSGEEIFTRGLRNAVGIVFRPGAGELWASNNGRDMLGDDLPPETINLATEGADFGWPRCHAGTLVDPDFGGPDACQGVTAPLVQMQAHSAPLGLTFYTGSQFPAGYQGGLFVAFHGSWNRSEPTGYKVVFVPVSEGQPGSVQDFATGWLTGGSAWGRPVDVLTAADGSLLVSDDSGGRVYRIFYAAP